MQVGHDKQTSTNCKARLWFGLDKQLSTLVLKFNNIFLISSGYRQTEFYFPTCIKPCSLAAIQMTAYKTGQNGDYFWIEFSGNSMTLYDILNRCSNVLQNKYLAIVCFDSGPLGLVNEEKDLGWYEKNNIAFSPKLTEEIIAALPTEQHDQWCLFKTPTEFSGMTYFVNYGGFTLASRRHELVEADPTWDKVGIEKQIEYHEQLVAQFWNELSAINPMNLIADGDNLIFISKELNEIEIVKKHCR